jgi:putative tryptophan/tyrosine transport system substrate-binding protein
MLDLRRREFITLLAGAAAGWPLATRAQQAGLPVIGFLGSGSLETDAFRVAAFRQGLSERGYVEGRNVTFEYRWAEGQYERLPALANDLVRRQVALIAAIGASPSARAAKGATTSIPIVFASGTDPVKLGLVASLNRPGNNLTGVSFLINVLVTKQFELLRETVPNATVIGFLVNPSAPGTESDTRDVQAAADAVGQKLVVVKAAAASEFEAAFETLVQQGVNALLVNGDAFFTTQHKQIVAMAASRALPSIDGIREFVALGGLMSYGTNMNDAYRWVGIYAGRILKGEKPADLPVQQSVKVELVINLKTAKALSLTFPITLLGRADEVIE